MRGVSNELAQSDLGRLLLVEHDVERLSEVRGLGTLAPASDSPRPVARGDGIGYLGHFHDGAEAKPADPEPGGNEDPEDDEPGSEHSEP